MCGRVTLTIPDLHEVARLLEAHVEPKHAAQYRPRYNAAPTDAFWIAGLAHDLLARGEGGRRLLPAVWGFPSPRGLLINARSETAPESPAFRAAFQARRVIVPADGFFEWTGPKSARRPLWFRPRQGGLLWLAGLAETLPDGRLAFVVLTTEASEPVSTAHDRMPVLLTPETAARWLERPDPALLAPAPPGFLTATPVSRRVNDVANDDPRVLEPPDDLREEKQLKLW